MKCCTIKNHISEQKWHVWLILDRILQWLDSVTLSEIFQQLLCYYSALITQQLLEYIWQGDHYVVTAEFRLVSVIHIIFIQNCDCTALHCFDAVTVACNCDKFCSELPSVLWHCVRQEGHQPVKNFEWWGAGVVICLERDADLHMAQLIHLPLTVSCFSKIQIVFTFLVPAHLGSPRQRAVKRVCVYSDTLLFRCWPWQWHAAFRKCRAAYNSLFYRDLWKFMAWRLPSMWHHQREKNSQHCRQQPGSQCGFAASGLRRPILPMSPAIWRKSNIRQTESWTRWFNQKQVCVHLPTYVDNVALPAFAHCWAADIISYLLGKVAEAGWLLWTHAGTHRQHTMWAVVITRIIKLPLLLHPFKGLFSRTPR